MDNSTQKSFSKDFLTSPRRSAKTNPVPCSGRLRSCMRENFSRRFAGTMPASFVMLASWRDVGGGGSAKVPLLELQRCTAYSVSNCVGEAADGDFLTLIPPDDNWSLLSGSRFSGKTAQ